MAPEQRGAQVQDAVDVGAGRPCRPHLFEPAGVAACSRRPAPLCAGWLRLHGARLSVPPAGGARRSGTARTRAGIVEDRHGAGARVPHETELRRPARRATRVALRPAAVLVARARPRARCRRRPLADEHRLAERTRRSFGSSSSPQRVRPRRAVRADRRRPALRRADGRAARALGGGDLVKIGPTRDDLADRLYDYHLDFPGNALDPGCDYERWARRITEGNEPTVYAHVATDPDHPGQLALQYWFFYAFNDLNNLHEGDWEMIQLVFDADDAARGARRRRPSRSATASTRAPSGRTGTTTSSRSSTARIRSCYPAAGSHANFYDEALYLGSSADAGRRLRRHARAARELVPVVHTIPSDPAAAQAAFPWIAFEGRWGELQPAFYNGPTGPNLKTQWTEPIAWAETWRDRELRRAGGRLLGTGATDFFCGAVAAGSTRLVGRSSTRCRCSSRSPGSLVLASSAVSRATWRPVAPLRLARRRAWGQILAAAGRMYVDALRLFLGIGAPASSRSRVVITLLQALVLAASSLVGVDDERRDGGASCFLVVALGTAFTLLGLGLVQAATAWALVEIDAGRPIGPVQAYRLALDSVAAAARRARRRRRRGRRCSLSTLVPDPGRDLARGALGAARPRSSSSRALVARRRAPQRRARARRLAQGRLARRRRRRARARRRPVPRRAADPPDRPPFALLNLVAGVVYALAMPFVALDDRTSTSTCARGRSSRETDDPGRPARRDPALGLSSPGPRAIRVAPDWVLIVVVVVVRAARALRWSLLYNGLVQKRNRVDNAWAQIDVQLKRRRDLIPNLVETVKGYAAHERGTFEAVTAGARGGRRRADARPRPARPRAC